MSHSIPMASDDDAEIRRNISIRHFVFGTVILKYLITRPWDRAWTIVAIGMDNLKLYRHLQVTMFPCGILKSFFPLFNGK